MKLSEIQNLMRAADFPPDVPRPKNQQQILQKLGLESGNFYQELEMESRYVDTHRDISWSNATVSLHSHSFYER